MKFPAPFVLSLSTVFCTWNRHIELSCHQSSGLSLARCLAFSRPSINISPPHCQIPGFHLRRDISSFNVEKGSIREVGTFELGLERWVEGSRGWAWEKPKRDLEKEEKFEQKVQWEVGQWWEVRPWVPGWVGEGLALSSRWQGWLRAGGQCPGRDTGGGLHLRRDLEGCRHNGGTGKQG